MLELSLPAYEEEKGEIEGEEKKLCIKKYTSRSAVERRGFSFVSARWVRENWEDEKLQCIIKEERDFPEGSTWQKKLFFNLKIYLNFSNTCHL